MSYEYVMYVGIKGMLRFNFAIEREMIGDKIRWFDTTTKRAVDYVEKTPFNKGSLWKVRKFYKHYHVLYGTTKIAHCSSLQSALAIIINGQHE